MQCVKTSMFVDCHSVQECCLSTDSYIYLQLGGKEKCFVAARFSLSESHGDKCLAGGWATVATVKVRYAVPGVSVRYQTRAAKVACWAMRSATETFSRVACCTRRRQPARPHRQTMPFKSGCHRFIAARYAIESRRKRKYSCQEKKTEEVRLLAHLSASNQDQPIYRYDSIHVTFPFWFHFSFFKRCLIVI